MLAALSSGPFAAPETRPPHFTADSSAQLEQRVHASVYTPCILTAWPRLVIRALSCVRVPTCVLYLRVLRHSGDSSCSDIFLRRPFTFVTPAPAQLVLQVHAPMHPSPILPLCLMFCVCAACASEQSPGVVYAPVALAAVCADTASFAPLRHACSYFTPSDRLLDRPLPPPLRLA